MSVFEVRHIYCTLQEEFQGLNFLLTEMTIFKVILIILVKVYYRYVLAIYNIFLEELRVNLVGWINLINFFYFQ